MVQIREEQLGNITILDKDQDGNIDASESPITAVGGIIYEELSVTPGNNSIWISDDSPSLPKFTDSAGTTITLGSGGGGSQDLQSVLDEGNTATKDITLTGTITATDGYFYDDLTVLGDFSFPGYSNTSAGLTIGKGTTLPFPAIGNNVVLGPNNGAGLASGDSNNVFIGELVGNTGDNNIAIGNDIMTSLANDGSNNIGLGAQALKLATTSTSQNIAIGNQALYNFNTGGLANIAIGQQAGSGITGGIANIAIGSQAFAGSPANGGFNNIAIGSQTLSGFVSGGNANIIIGNQTATNLASGSNNIFIGTQSNVGSLVNTSDMVVIGSQMSGCDSGTSLDDAPYANIVGITATSYQDGGARYAIGLDVATDLANTTGRLTVHAGLINDPILELSSGFGNVGISRLFSGNSTPVGSITGTPGDFFIQSSGTSSNLYQHTGSSSNNSSWSALGGAAALSSVLTIGNITGTNNIIINDGYSIVGVDATGTNNGGAVTLRAGIAGATSGTGGVLTISGGASGSASGFGGALILKGGDNATGDSSGAVQLYSGSTTQNGMGAVEISTGGIITSSYTGSGATGAITIKSQNRNNNSAGTSTGAITVRSGDSIGTNGSSGNVVIGGAVCNTSGSSGSVGIYGQNGWTGNSNYPPTSSNALGGVVNVQGGHGYGTSAGGTVNINGGNKLGTGGSGSAGTVVITGGAGTAGTGSQAGGVTLTAGTTSGSATPAGSILIKSGSKTNSSQTTAAGSVTVTGGDSSGTAGGDVVLTSGYATLGVGVNPSILSITAPTASLPGNFIATFPHANSTFTFDGTSGDVIVKSDGGIEAADGYFHGKVTVDGLSTIYSGAVSPVSVITGNPGDIYIFKSGVLSNVYQHVGASADNTSWKIINRNRVIKLTGTGVTNTTVTHNDFDFGFGVSDNLKGKITFNLYATGQSSGYLLACSFVGYFTWTGSPTVWGAPTLLSKTDVGYFNTVSTSTNGNAFRFNWTNDTTETVNYIIEAISEAL